MPIAINNAEVIDTRSESEKITDEALGAKGLAAFDRHMSRIVKAAESLFLNKTQTKKYLTLGEYCYDALRDGMEAGGKRDALILRITTRLEENHIAPGDVRVNDWLAVFGLAKCVTMCDSVDDMPSAFVSGHAYRTLAYLKQALERDEYEYSFKPGWADFVTTALERGVRGKALEDAVKAHAKAVAEMHRSDKLRGMPEEAVKSFLRQEAAAERTKIENNVTKAAKALAKAAMDAGYSSDDLVATLVTNGAIAPIQPVSVPLAPDAYAVKMTKDEATAFANAIIERGDRDIAMQIASLLSGWLKATEPKLAASA